MASAAATTSRRRPPPGARLITITQPVLLTIGITADAHLAGLPADFFGAAADATMTSLPNGSRATIDVPGHIPEPAIHGPVLTAFFIS